LAAYPSDLGLGSAVGSALLDYADLSFHSS
jgi:hypothetical protein